LPAWHKSAIMPEDKIITKNLSPDLSVVVLCYQTGKNTETFVESIIKHFFSNNITNYELVLVGNYHPGKKDDTPEVLRLLAAKYAFVKFVAKPKQGMMGWDMRSGLEIASGNFIAIIDGDGQMPIDDIARVYKEIKSSDCDLVKTFRTKRGDGAWRRIISIVYNAIFILLFPGVFYRDINSKPKIFSRSALNKLHLCSNDWFIDAEIMILARRHKLIIKEIPTNFFKLADRASYVKFSAIFEFIKNLIIFRIKEFKK